MIDLHKLMFEVVHKMMIPRQERRIEVNQANIPTSISGTNRLVQWLRKELAEKDLEMAKMRTDHRDAILLIMENMQ
ncbi:hypothetical protein HAX54_000674 [Datura stramonium]|uniref:Uncharacterized protein n=1 Tax=Datura stramonium TaxID=4076 RepID=A0ABS8T1A2_DATST|nr:hypothetical protein [Datura stramonium]